MKQRWTIDQLKCAIAKHYSIRSVLQELCLNATGGNYKHIKDVIVKNKLDISHFTGKIHRKCLGKRYPRRPLKDYLIKGIISSIGPWFKKRLFRRWIIEK